ncbi:MAG: hypothetical protein IJN13_01695 [Bacilli bacterium]|nr:hypothetical protein [Bacilli bacterium]
MIKKYSKVLIVLLLLVEFTFVFLSIKSFNNKDIKEIKEENKVNKEMFSMYVENKDGEYEEYTDSEYYPIGLKYYFNEERSNCTDNKGKVINDVISYNNNKITVSSNKTLFCYLYFDLDKIPPQTFTFYLGGNTNPEYITSTSTTAYLSWTDNDIESYCINTENNSSTCNWVNTSGNTITPSYTISTQGSNTRYAFIRDAAENISPVVSDSVFLDSVAPVITSASDSGAGTANVTVTETGSGVTYVCVNQSSTSTTGCTWDEVSGTTFTSTTAVTATGSYYIHVKDKAGNIGHKTSAISIAKPVWNLYTLCSKYSNIDLCEQNENLEDVDGIWNSTLEDDGYRYVGTNPNNYVCFGTTNKSTCTGNTDLYMYRIIGIFEDSSGNQHLKLIKKEALNTKYKMHSTYSVDIDWDEMQLYKEINGSYFLTNTTYSYMQNSAWLEKISNWDWTAANSGYYPNHGSNYYYMTPQAVYIHELNRSTKTNQKCYNNYSSNGFTTADCSVGEWKEVTTKIGLMYVSDYMLSLGASFLDLWCGNYNLGAASLNTEAVSNVLKTGWLNLKNSDSSPPNPGEWTMTIAGATSNPIEYAYIINTNGTIVVTGIAGTNNWSVRPVFYLTSDIKITGGTGSSTDPFLIN